MDDNRGDFEVAVRDLAQVAGLDTGELTGLLRADLDAGHTDFADGFGIVEQNSAGVFLEAPFATKAAGEAALFVVKCKGSSRGDYLAMTDKCLPIALYDNFAVIVDFINDKSPTSNWAFIAPEVGLEPTT